MAYRKVGMIQLKEIFLRICDGQSKRQVREVMGIHGNTLNKYLDIARDLGTDIATCRRDDITDELIESVHQKIGIIKDRPDTAPRDVILLPYKDRIEDYLKKDVPGTKIVKILAREDTQISQTSFYRFVKTHLPQYAKSNITVRLPETKAGIYAQADFGYLGRLWDSSTKKMRRAFAFIMTLVFSRHMYVHITFSQDADAVIEGCEAAWSYFGGISKIVIVDNMTPVIDKPDRYAPKINSLFMEYSQYRGFIIDPANIGHAKGKPHVERMVPYARRSFFLGEDFISKDDCQERAIDWCSHIAGTRVHGTTRKIPIDMFENIEKVKLTDYPGDRYDTPYWSECKVHPDHHIQFRKSLYSLPTKYIGKTVEVRGDSALVRIYHNGKLIKTHTRVDIGKRSTDFSDYPKELTPYTLRNPVYQIQEGKKRHPVIGEYIEFMLSGTYPWHRLRSVQRLLRLSDKYGAGRTAAACRKAKAYGIYDISRIENILKNNVEKVMVMPDEPAPFEESSRFKRDGNYFKNYKS
jgi:hypothetical protein